MPKIINKQVYTKFINDIGFLLEEARRDACYAVNNVLTKVYWEIGRRIVEFEQGGKKRAEYGGGLIDVIAKDLTVKHGKGFSAYNVRKMRQFYLIFKKWETVSPKLTIY